MIEFNKKTKIYTLHASQNFLFLFLKVGSFDLWHHEHNFEERIFYVKMDL